MSRIDLRGADLSVARLRTTLPRGGVDVDAVVPTVRPIAASAAAIFTVTLDLPTPPLPLVTA